MTSSDSVCKTMSHCFIQSVSNLVYHLYSICRMYSEENPQGFPPYSSSPLFLSVSNAVSECRSCFKLGNSLPWEFTSENLSQLPVLCRPFLAYEGSVTDKTLNGLSMFRHKTASYRHQTRIEKIKNKTKLRLVSFLYFIYIYRNCLHLHIQSKVNRYKANLFFQLLQTFHFLCFQELIDTTKMFFYLFIPKFIHFRH